MTPPGSWERTTPGDLAAVAAGGALGTLLRVLGHTLRPQTPGAFPWTTLGENLLGAFLLGWLAAWLLARWSSSRTGAGTEPPPGPPPEPRTESVPASSLRARLFLTTGVLGSFTTFSALAVEGVELLALAPGTGFAYLGASLVLGPLLAWAGLRVGKGTS